MKKQKIERVRALAGSSAISSAALRTDMPVPADSLFKISKYLSAFVYTYVESSKKGAPAPGNR
jgi:hypothetical protein